MSSSVRIVVLLAVSATLASASAASALTSGPAAEPAVASAQLGAGKRLYRKYCGQCHALKTALAAGFGTENGLGTNGGPSFDNLRVPFNLSVVAVTSPFIGHEVLVRKMKWNQVRQVATYVATVTKSHPVPALPTDG